MTLDCTCNGAEHIVCRDDIPHPKLRDPWRKLAPWLADYGHEGAWGGLEEHQAPNKPNLAARRNAAAKLGVVVKAPVVVAKRRADADGCPCQGREHIVCRQDFAAMLRVDGMYDRVVFPCERFHYDRRHPRTTRQRHTRACRVLTLAKRYDAITPRTHRRLLRLWLGVLRAAWS